MKKLFVAFCLALCMGLLFAADVSSLLDSAKNEYASGNLSGAVQKIDEAKKLIEAEQLSNSQDDYIEVPNWDVIDLKTDSYVNKKVKMKGKYWGVSGSDKININVRLCTFEKSLIDKILELEKIKEYTFYGTLKNDRYEPYMHVEAIE